MKKIGRILLGWWYWTTNHNNKLAQDRLKICVDCELYKWFVCTECGCPGQTKARIKEESCPHPDGNKWRYIDNYHRIHPMETETFELDSNGKIKRVK